MNSWNPVCRTVTMIAVSLIALSGCSGGSATNGVDSAAVSTVPPVTIPTTQPEDNVPNTPTGVSAVGGTNKVTLSWKAVSNATSYNIYWSATTGVTVTTGTEIGNASPGYIHKGLLPAATYYYIVTSQNNSGESSASGQVSATTVALDGSVPYTTYCASCHGRLATSTVTNKSTTDIKTALQGISAMSALTLTDSQITAISAALMYNN